MAAVAVGPVFGGRMVPQPRPAAEQAWWSQAAGWLASNSGDGRALIVPGAGRPNLVWGQTVDDPLQPLARSPWSVRDGLPLTQPGYVRFLDAIDQILARGQRDDGLQVLLARAGVKYLLLRNDLDSVVAGSTKLANVHATVANSPGLLRVAQFGPDFGGPTGFASVTDEGGWPQSPAVQIYRVADYAGVIGLLPASFAIAATGSTDALTSLVSRGVGVDQPVLFGASAAADPSATSVATDGIRRRDVLFGAADQYPATLAADAPFELTRAAHDYLPDRPGPLSTMQIGGVASVQASSAGSDLGAFLNRGAMNAPFSAVDSLADTAWKSSAVGAIGQWLQIDFSKPLNPAGAQIGFASELGDYPSRIRVTTDAGVLDSDVASDGKQQPLQVAIGTTRRLRITVLSMAGAGQSVGIATLNVPGMQATRSLQVPTAGSPDVLAFDVATGYHAECLPVAGAAACDPANVAAGEEDGELSRSFTLTASRPYHVAATVRLRPSAGLTAALDALNPVTARASSTQTDDPRLRAGAAVDGNPATTWTAAATDSHPSLTIRLPRAQRLTGLVLSTSVAAPVSRPTRLAIRAGNRSWTADLPDDGQVEFSHAVTTSSITVMVLAEDRRTSSDPQTHAIHQLPVGMGELSLIGAKFEPPGGTLTIGCNAGLLMQIDGRTLPLTAKVQVQAALDSTPVLATPCADDLVELSRGQHQLRLLGTEVVAPESITATADGMPPFGGSAQNAGTATATAWSATSRRVRVHATAAAFLVVRENANAGWQASINGVRLKAVTLDGWQQGYLIPAGSSGTVQLSFEPQRSFLAGLLIGAIAVLVLLALCWWPSRRRPPSVIEEGQLGRIASALLLAATGFALLSVPGLVLALGLVGLIAASRPLPGSRAAGMAGWLGAAAGRPAGRDLPTRIGTFSDQ